MRRRPALLLPLLLLIVAGEAAPARADAPPAAGPPAAAPQAPRQVVAAGAGFVEEKIALPIFGRVRVFRPDPVEGTRGVVLFLSGDGGFKSGVVEMARRTAPSAIVVGLSFPAWKKVAELDRGRCWYPAGDLESIAQAVEKIYRLPRYLPPILIGFSSGATAAYGALAQAPGETFAGGVSLGFCPDLEIDRPWCAHGDWKPRFDSEKKTSLLPPRPDLPRRADGSSRWLVLQGLVDKVCDASEASRFAAAIPAARVLLLAKVGHGFGVTRNWGEAYDRAVGALLDPVTAWERPPGEAAPAAPATPEAIRSRLEALDLPLTLEWPPEAKAALLFVSGDGGWAELDQSVARALARQGVAVVGWSSLRYFWTAKTPGRFRDDLARLLEALPEDLPVFAGGYSFGAEVIPSTLVAARSDPASPLRRLAGLVLLAPGPYASFEVSPLDWLRSSEPETEHSVRTSIQALTGLPILCLEPSDREASGCPDGLEGVSRVKLPGGHHFAGDYDALAERIAAFLLHQPPSGQPPSGLPPSGPPPSGQPPSGQPPSGQPPAAPPPAGPRPRQEPTPPAGPGGPSDAPAGSGGGRR